MQLREAQVGLGIAPELASLAIPGLGQLLQGRLVRAALWFIPACALWALALVPYELGAEVILVIPLALALHLASARAVLLAENSTQPDRPESLWSALPLFLCMKVLGGVLLAAAALHFLMTGADLLRVLTEAQVRWGGGFVPFSLASRAGHLVERSVIMVGLGVIGFALYQIGSLWQMRTAEQMREQRLLQEAHARGGALTVPEAAAIMQLSFQEAHDLLEEMTQRRWIGVSTTENGQKVYHFLNSPQ